MKDNFCQSTESSWGTFHTSGLFVSTGFFPIFITNINFIFDTICISKGVVERLDLIFSFTYYGGGKKWYFAFLYPFITLSNWENKILLSFLPLITYRSRGKKWDLFLFSFSTPTYLTIPISIFSKEITIMTYDCHS